MGCGDVVKELCKAMRRPVEADAFLLEPHTSLNAIVAQIVLEGSLLGCTSHSATTSTPLRNNASCK